MDTTFKRTKFACYWHCYSGATVFTLPPLLFITFREMYGISYTLLGTLILVNFCTQLFIDLIFTFFTKLFNIKKTVRILPVLTSLGLFVYALSPFLFKGNEYAGLLIGTVIFSIAAGLAEVLISPIIAAIPSDTPDKDMSLLHSLYGWGVVSVVIVSTLFFMLFGSHNWMYLSMFFALLPILTCILFCMSPLPEMKLGNEKGVKSDKGKKIGIGLCFMCIFLGAAAENSMMNWVSGYLEAAIGITKSLGDILGMALFALLLAFARTLYAKYGKNISYVMLISMITAAVCYIIVGMCNNAVVSLFACVAIGFCTSMLWPGTLIWMEEEIECPGVAAYALMAAGGDLGSSVAPQLMGIVVDNVSVSGWAQKLGTALNMTSEQIGMKTGMLITAIFPILGTLLIIYMIKYFKRKNPVRK